jgi:hypothetical protein
MGGMSALSLLHRDKQTLPRPVGTSALCQEATFAFPSVF